MTNLSYQTYKELAIPYFKETFDIVDEVMSHHQVPYYLIGASAIDLEFHNDVFPEDDFDQRIIAAEVLGRKARSIIKKSAKLSERIHQVLDSNLDEISESEISKVWAQIREWDVEYSYSLLKAFERGLGKS